VYLAGDTYFLLIQSAIREQLNSERDLSKRRPDIDLDEALEDLFRWMNRPVTRAEWDEFTSWLEEAARVHGDTLAAPRRVGRPKAGSRAHLGDDRISASFRAAEDVFQHLQEFRRRNGICRLPKGVTQAIIDEVLSYRINADEVLVAEYLRENRKHFRHLDEDTEN
jgi:hypothetical protein